MVIYGVRKHYFTSWYSACNIIVLMHQTWTYFFWISRSKTPFCILWVSLEPLFHLLSNTATNFLLQTPIKFLECFDFSTISSAVVILSDFSDRNTLRKLFGVIAIICVVFRKAAHPSERCKWELLLSSRMFVLETLMTKRTKNTCGLNPFASGHLVFASPILSRSPSRTCTWFPQITIRIIALLHI